MCRFAATIFIALISQGPPYKVTWPLVEKAVTPSLVTVLPNKDALKDKQCNLAGVCITPLVTLKQSACSCELCGAGRS